MIYKDTFHMTNQPEYHEHFWYLMSGITTSEGFLEAGQHNGGYVLPAVSESNFIKELKEKSLVRRLATVAYSRGNTPTIRAQDSQDIAVWVKENQPIPIYDGINDFTDIPVECRKLAVVLKMSNEYLHDNRRSFEHYLTGRLVKNFAGAEEKAFISGTGEEEPIGITADEGGADIGVETSAMTFDDVLELFYSVDKDYRANGTWLMNDSTALVLRRLKDDSGMPLWNHSNDTILGRPVVISNYMPDIDTDSKPIAFGDFSYYWLVDRDRTEVRTLMERFAEIGQIGYLAAEYLDGKLIRSEAVKVLKITEDAE